MKNWPGTPGVEPAALDAEQRVRPDRLGAGDRYAARVSCSIRSCRESAISVARVRDRVARRPRRRTSVVMQGTRADERGLADQVAVACARREPCGVLTTRSQRPAPDRVDDRRRPSRASSTSSPTASSSAPRCRRSRAARSRARRAPARPATIAGLVGVADREERRARRSAAAGRRRARPSRTRSAGRRRSPSPRRSSASPARAPGRSRGSGRTGSTAALTLTCSGAPLLRQLELVQARAGGEPARRRRRG